MYNVSLYYSLISFFYLLFCVRRLIMNKNVEELSNAYKMLMAEICELENDNILSLSIKQSIVNEQIGTIQDITAQIKRVYNDFSIAIQEEKSKPIDIFNGAEILDRIFGEEDICFEQTALCASEKESDDSDEYIDIFGEVNSSAPLIGEQFERKEENGDNDEFDESNDGLLLDTDFDCGEEKSLLDTDRSYRYIAEEVCNNYFAYIFSGMKSKKFNDKQIASVFDVSLEYVKDCVSQVVLSDNSIPKARDIDFLEDIIINAYNSDYPKPSWLKTTEKEFILAQIINNAIIRMNNNNISDDTIMALTGVNNEEIDAALRRGFQNIYAKAGESR